MRYGSSYTEIRTLLLAPTFLGDRELAPRMTIFAILLPEPSALKDWFNDPIDLGDGSVEARLKGFAAEANWRVSFDRVLQLALHQQPTSYWDIVGHQNPRMGTETVRHRPRAARQQPE